MFVSSAAGEVLKILWFSLCLSFCRAPKIDDNFVSCRNLKVKNFSISCGGALLPHTGFCVCQDRLSDLTCLFMALPRASEIGSP